MKNDKKWLGIFLMLVFLIGSVALAGDVDWTANSPRNVTNNAVPVDTGDESVFGIAWQTNSPIPIANGLSQTTLVAANGLVYIIGGGLGAGPDTRINQLWAYDPDTDTYTRKADIPLATGLSAYGSAVEYNGKIYVFGGITGPPGPTMPINNTWIYDVEGNTWSAGANLPAPRFGSSVAVVGDKIYVSGGASSVIEMDNWEYDPGADTFTPRAPLPAGTPSPVFRIHGVGLSDQGLLHAFAGGFDGINHLVYIPKMNMWLSGHFIPIGVTDPGVVAIGDILYVLGGPVPAPGRAQAWDTVNGGWTQGPMMPGPLNNTGATVVGNTIYVIGGFNGTTSVPVNYSLTIP